MYRHYLNQCQPCHSRIRRELPYWDQNRTDQDSQQVRHRLCHYRSYRNRTGRERSCSDQYHRSQGSWEFRHHLNLYYRLTRYIHHTRQEHHHYPCQDYRCIPGICHCSSVHRQHQSHNLQYRSRTRPALS